MIGAGIIGLSLAIELNKRGMKVLVIDKGEPGREASWAAGGMLADFPLEMPSALAELAAASARMYPEFVRELEDESGLKIDLRSVGALVFVDPTTGHGPGVAGHSPATTLDSGPADDSVRDYRLPRPVLELEPHLAEDVVAQYGASFLQERSVDPRHLTAAAVAAAKYREIDFSSGNAVLAIAMAEGKAVGVLTSKTQFGADVIVNCAGAWAAEIIPLGFPTRPVKGQMLCVVMPEKEFVRHVIRTPEVYLIPRSDGRMLIGATQEEAGFDKRTVPETIQKLRQAALESGSEACGGAISGGLGGTPSGNARCIADSGGDVDAGILCGDRAFSRWDFVGAGDGSGYGRDDLRGENDVRPTSVC